MFTIKEFDPDKHIQHSQFASDILKEDYYVVTDVLYCKVLDDKDFSVRVPKGYIFKKWNIPSIVVKLVKDVRILLIYGYLCETGFIACNNTLIRMDNVLVSKAFMHVLKHMNVPFYTRFILSFYLPQVKHTSVKKTDVIAKQAVQFFFTEKLRRTNKLP